MQPLESIHVDDDDARRSGELPMVLKFRPVGLGEIERRLVRDENFARSVIEREDFRLRLAHAVLHRDPVARERFRDAPSLAAHLLGRLRG